MNRRFSHWIWLLAVLGIPHSPFVRQVSAAESDIAATVGDDTIPVADVQRAADWILRNKKLSGNLLAMAQAQVLEVLIDRRLVLDYARQAGDLPTTEELAAAAKQLQIGLAARGRAASDAAKSGVKFSADIQRQALWELVCGRYVAKYCTPQRRETWFQKHHRDLDGTELVVSHILLRPGASPKDKEIDALVERAGAIRTEISSGKLDFAEAARKFSVGPSRNLDGRLGKIGRFGPQDEAFSRAAFQLQAGEISPPVRSPFGVHLIRCDEVVPGTKNLSDLVGPIDEALTKEMVAMIAQRQRQETPVKYSNAWPHFKPGTQELAK
jgi:peptidyl-prolyl cis-trans isomerase SurA